MADLDNTALSIVTGPLAGVPEPIQTTFFKALSNLLGGLTAIPAAKLKQYAQGIEDTTAARSIVSAEFAKAVAGKTVADPELLQAAIELQLPPALRKAKNRLQVAIKAAECLEDSVKNQAEGDFTASKPPEDDWMNSFMRFSEDASSERLQDLFGRILSGEIVNPGSFSQSTLRTVSELDQSIATDFSLVWSRSVGEAVDYSVQFHRGEYFARWKRLSEAGLMASMNTVQYLPEFRDIGNGNGLWNPMSAKGCGLTIQFPQNSQAQWHHISFTKVGRELGSILACPDFEGNMRAVAKGLANSDVVQIDLYRVGKPNEILYRKSV